MAVCTHGLELCAPPMLTAASEGKAVTGLGSSLLQGCLLSPLVRKGCHKNKLDDSDGIYSLSALERRVQHPRCCMLGSSRVRPVPRLVSLVHTCSLSPPLSLMLPFPLQMSVLRAKSPTFIKIPNV